MKKIIFLLSFLSVLLSQQTYAQPGYYFSPSELQVDPNESFCLDLRVDEFTDMIGVSFTIRFNPNVVQFESITSLNAGVPGLNGPNVFGTGTAGLGYITFVWTDGQPCQSAVGGTTLPDQDVLFSICFKAIGQYGEHTGIEFSNDPIDIISRRATALCFDIGELYLGNGFVSIGTRPLKIDISSASGNTGETVCIDFKVRDFKDLISAQYYIFYDANILEFQNLMKMNLGNTGDQYEVFHNSIYKMISTSWFNDDLNDGKSIPDGTQILQACFKIIGTCGQVAPIYIGPNPNSQPIEPIEVIDEITGQNTATAINIGLLSTPGEVAVNCVDPDGITINMADKNVCPGQTFTVDVKVEDFNQIAKLMFDLKWNKDVIEYVDPPVYPTQPGGNCLPWSSGFDDGDALTQGLIHMDWSSLGPGGCNKPDGYILFRLTFRVKGPSGSSTNISVVDPIFVDKFGGVMPENIGINTNNSFVQVCTLNSPTISAESVNANPGENICIDFPVQDFGDITNLEFTLAYETAILEFTELIGFNLPGLGLSNFNTTQANNLGVIGVNWSNPAGETVPDGISLFQACFNVIGDIDSCGLIAFGSNPFPIDVQTLSSNQTDVGLNGQSGQVCVTNPFVFNVSLPEEYSGQNSTICVDLTVENFNQLTNMEFSINWDVDILNLESVNPTGAIPNFTASNYDDTDAADGNLSIDWAAANQVLGFSVPNGTSILELCFRVRGQSGECSPISVSGYPKPTKITSATTGQTLLNMSSDEGRICVSGAMSLSSFTVTEVTCGGTPNGTIDIDIIGGSGQYAYQWSGPCANPTAADQTNLCVGNYVVTVTDVLNPTLKIIKPFNVVYSTDAIFANAGRDTTFSCGTFSMILNGTGSTLGPNISYLWENLGSGLVLPNPPGNSTSLTPEVIGGSRYRLTVIGPGCVDRDTVQIAAAQIPVAYIDSLPGKLSCLSDTIELDGSLSPVGFDPIWTGPAVVPGTETFLRSRVTEPGLYILTLIHPITGCSDTDTVLVVANDDLPIADAGADNTLGCNTSSVPIGGANTSSGANFMYDWVPVGGGQLCGNPQAATLSACSAGTFQLTVTDTLNGCTAMDEVVIDADVSVPLADAGEDAALNCTVDMVTLDGSGSTPGLSYTWTNTATGLEVAQGTLNPQITTAGIYQLEVMNPSNNCSAIDQVVVDDDSQGPTPTATASNDIDCMVTEATLEGGGAIIGSNFSYSWRNATGAEIGTAIEVTVSAPGTYTLVVTDAATTCTGTASVTVDPLNIAPVVNAGADMSITCDEDEVVLEGTYDTSNPNLQPQWVSPSQQCIQNANTATATATCPGTYVFQVYNNLTGCLGTDEVVVADDMDDPSVDAGDALVLPCLGSSVVLQGSTDATAFTAAWASFPDGLPITGGTTLEPTVTQPGSYTLTIKSTVNGCTAFDNVVVTIDTSNPIQAVATASNNGVVDCDTPTVTLDGSGSSPSVMYEWTELDGTPVATTATTEVGEGVYMLTVTGAGNCKDTASVTVVDNAINIVVTADTLGHISCETPTAEIQGTVSINSPGLILLWTDASGQIVDNGLNATVSSPGEYTLTVSDSNTGCVGSASVVVQQYNPNLTPAQAEFDYADCTTTATLMGNLPPNTTGVWTSLDGAIVDSPTAATTEVLNLAGQENAFVWSLSIGDCPNYDSDTVTIAVNLTVPNAVSDNAILTPTDGGEITVNVLENDEFDPANGTFNLLPYVGFGEVLAADNGEVTFIKEKCLAGQLQVQYEICDLTCPDLCDEATLTIEVQADPTEDCDPKDAPNGITPNGDGVNDALFFDVLLSGESFPDNEIIIFNRWGDQVYHAKPYNNDWQGTNKNGKDLPQATYYYILRLNIADGVILRGDVTILK
ncbi:MAG: gliding motility-associated C-terminal domain-containing protein [Saprospiraceae bacterium]|nr:gliding motility-associated C-terminal domain-containing protein [Saprospiraceae bacterium]